ncbi:MAG TPA: hypothetical protein VK966_13775, partial [Longimicrobiales bacterium]|nr:hypothetical protein [Longimicrobiales bacterium]
LHYDRLLALPLVAAHGSGGASYRAMIEAVMEADAGEFPELGRIRRLLDDHAAAIQRGAPEPIPARDWLELWWPADQWIIIDMVTRFATEAFYEEAERVITGFLSASGWSGDDVLVREAFRLNQALLAQPFEIDNATMALQRDVLAVYDAVLAGRPLPPPRPAAGRIVRTDPTWLSWAEWLEHLTFCHNQKSAYLWRWEPQPAAAGTRVPA